MTNYSYDEIKQCIGSQAELIIANALNIQSDRSGNYPCQITEHAGNATMKWLGSNFHCCNCGGDLDIWDFLKLQYPDKWFTQALELAGISSLPQKDQENKSVKKNLQEQVQKQEGKSMKKKVQDEKHYSANFSGLQNLKPKCEGLSDIAIKWLMERRLDTVSCLEMGLSANDHTVYFNYLSVIRATPGQEDDANDKWNLCKIKGRKIGNFTNKAKDKYSGDAGGEGILFGVHNYMGQSRLIICEGELDCVAMWIGINYIKAQHNIMCVSVPYGAQSFGWIYECEAFLRQFETIIICADANADGIDMRENCILRLTEMKFDVRWIDIRRKLKEPDGDDINKLLISNGRAAVANLLTIIEHPSHTCGLTIDLIKPDNSPKLFLLGTYGVDRSCKFKIPGLTLFAGSSNAGKSTLLRQWQMYAIGCGLKIGTLYAEEENITFRDLCIRQFYGKEAMCFDNPDFFNDCEPIAKDEYIEKFNRDYGQSINLFQMDKIDNSKPRNIQILDWIRHCADVEGRTSFYLDNLQKIIHGEKDEYLAQAHLIDDLYTLSKQKNLHIMLVAHTKKIDGFMNINSLHGTMKIYNIPDYVLFYERLDRMTFENKKDTIEKAASAIREKARVGPNVQFDSYIRSHKVRNRPTVYEVDWHILRYDPVTTCSLELLPVEEFMTSPIKPGFNSVCISYSGALIPEKNQQKTEENWNEKTDVQPDVKSDIPVEKHQQKPVEGDSNDKKTD